MRALREAEPSILLDVPSQRLAGVAAALEEPSGEICRPLLADDAPGYLEKVWTHGRRTAIYFASAPEVEGVSGKYVIREKETPSVPISYNKALLERMWDILEKLTDVRHSVPCAEGTVRGHPAGRFVDFFQAYRRKNDREIRGMNAPESSVKRSKATRHSVRRGPVSDLKCQHAAVAYAEVCA